MEQPGAYKTEQPLRGVSPSGLGSSESAGTAKTPTVSPSGATAERLIPESQIRDAIKEILAEMLGVNTTAQPQRQWHDTDPAYFHLDLDSCDQLREMVRNGMLRIGIEVRDVRSPTSQIPRYQFHIEKCEARLLQRPEKRQGKKTA